MKWRAGARHAAVDRAVPAHRPHGCGPRVRDGRDPHQLAVRQGWHRLSDGDAVFPTSCRPKCARRSATTSRACPTTRTRSCSRRRSTTSSATTMVNIESPLCVTEVHYQQKQGITAHVTRHLPRRSLPGHRGGQRPSRRGQQRAAPDRGRLRARHYTEHALETGATSQAASYVGIATPEGQLVWGRGHPQRHHPLVHPCAGQRDQPHAGPSGRGADGIPAGLCRHTKLLKGTRQPCNATAHKLSSKP